MEIWTDHNVYILGAGFSADAGVPLVAGFLNQMRDAHSQLADAKRTREAQAVKRVLEFRLTAASAAYWVTLDLENIEELFSLAAAAHGDMHEHIRLAIAATVDVARSSAPPLNRKMNLRGRSKLFGIGDNPGWAKYVGNPSHDVFNNENPGPYEIQAYAYHVGKLLGMFQDGKPQGQNSFITFNYDTLLEEALDQLQLPYWYGFDPTLADWWDSAKGIKLAGETALPVLKLHGSMNWARAVDVGALRIFKSYDEVRDHNLVPELIPPTWKKVFEKQLEAVWQTAIQKLNSATRIVIIGFSMPDTDLHFKYLMAAGLRSNASLRQILFVNPSAAVLEAKARNLLRNAYVDSKTIDFDPHPLHIFTQGHPGKLWNIGRRWEQGVGYDLHQ